MACKVSDVDGGGYDVMFIEEPPEFLLCIVCHLALRKPIQIIDCGHRFGRSCFEKMKLSSSERGTDLLCPLDRHVIDTSKVFPDKGYERLVMELKVNCDNQGKGCQWKGDLTSLKQHLNINCLYEFVSCVHKGCEEKSERRLLDGHMTNCSKRVVAADNLKLIQILTQRLQGLQESQYETKEELKETKEKLNETKKLLQLKDDEMKKFQERIVTLENDFKQLQRCDEEIIQNRDNFSSPSIKSNCQVLSEKIGEEVIQVKHVEWFTWKSYVPITHGNPLYSHSYLTDDGYRFKIEFGYHAFIDGYYSLHLYVFKDELNLIRCSSKKTISSQIGDIKKSMEVNMLNQQNNYFDKSSWSGYYLSGTINGSNINKNIINNYISIHLMIE